MLVFGAAAVCERSLLEGIPACIVVVLFVWFAVDVCVYECMFVHFLFFMFGYLSDNVRFFYMFISLFLMLIVRFDIMLMVNS